MLPDLMAYSIIFERSRKRHVLRGLLNIGSSSGKIFFRKRPGNKWQISHRKADNYAIILFGPRLQSAGSLAASRVREGYILSATVATVKAVKFAGNPESKIRS